MVILAAGWFLWVFCLQTTCRHLQQCRARFRSTTSMRHERQQVIRQHDNQNGGGDVGLVNTVPTQQPLPLGSRCFALGLGLMGFHDPGLRWLGLHDRESVAVNFHFACQQLLESVQNFPTMQAHAETANFWKERMPPNKKNFVAGNGIGGEKYPDSYNTTKMVLRRFQSSTPL